MRVGFVILAVALLPAPALAAMANAVSVEQLARESDAVVRAKVESVYSFRSEDRLRIYRKFELRTAKVIRGSASSHLGVVVPGGVDGHVTQVVDAAPRIAVGEDVVVFLRRAGKDFAVTEAAQGKFAVVGSVARPDLSQVVFVGSKVREGERRAEEMSLAELERRVRNVK